MTDVKDLARRAVACKGWRWAPGMLTLSGARILLVEDDGAYVLDGELPDFADDATLGCVLAMVRKAWGEPHMSLDCRLAARDKFEWTVTALVNPKIIPFYAFRGRGPSQAEALVTALEAAPA